MKAITNLTFEFTGKERDAETGLDYFGARYFAGAQGRFTSPDWSAMPQAVPYAILGDPQTLNLYAYVRNNPLSEADADGHCEPFCGLIAKLAVWAGTGVATQGGKQFAKNVAIGAAKGVGSVAYNTVMGSNPATALVSKLAGQPNVLQPSNQTQAQVKTTTEVGIAVASVAAAGIAGAATASGEAAESSTTFYHYGFLADEANFTGGLRPGAFATTDGGLTGTEAQSTLALPSRIQGVPDGVYPVTPEPGTPVNGPSTVRAAFGQPGGGQEVSFPQGTGPGTVGTPKPIPPR
jgi:RHS repeat-associated protein